MIGFYEVLVLPLLLERARDENHFISHATIAIVPNPVIVSMLYALNNAIDAATSYASLLESETYRLLPLCTMASSSTHQLRTFSTPN